MFCVAVSSARTGPEDSRGIGTVYPCKFVLFVDTLPEVVDRRFRPINGCLFC